MKAFFCILLALFFLENSHALYVQKISPSGTDVDPGLDAVRIEFSSDINKLGAGMKLSAEHLEKVSLSPDPGCQFSYDGTKTVVCRPAKTLSPGTSYKISVKTGFKGVAKDDRTSYNYDNSFFTSHLAISEYQVQWSNQIPKIHLSLNFPVKPQGLSGTIQCNEKQLPVEFLPMKDPKGGREIQVKGLEAQKSGELCVFYFNRPLSYRDSVGSHVPEQKVLLDETIQSITNNSDDFNIHARCESDYELRVKVFSKVMPYLKCEAVDSVIVELFLEGNQSFDISKLVDVIPKDKVVVSYDHGYLKFSNFSKDAKNYLINISKNIPMKKKPSKDTVLQVETVDGPPLIGVVKSMGVIEKNGPWKVAYSSLNVKELDLKYNLINDPNKLAQLANLLPEGTDLSHKKTIKLAPKHNENHMLPLDAKEIALDHKFEAGLFQGEVSVGEVDKRYLEAEAALIKNDYTRKSRRQFTFGYLLTDIGLHVKKGKESILVWAFSLKNGTPTARVNIALYHNGKKLNSMTTNDQGLAHFEEVPYGLQEFVAVATLGDDISFISSQYFWNQGISHWDFNLGRYYAHGQNRLVADIVADRPLYLPKEMVHLKLFVRKKSHDDLELHAAGSTATVIIMDPRGEQVVEKKIKLNSYGTATISHQLESKAATGQYSVVIKSGELGLTLESVFQVEEFRKPEFKVTLIERDKFYEGTLTYFKGGPVKDASGEVAVMYRRTSFMPREDELKSFIFSSAVQYWDYEGHRPSVEVLSRNEIESDDKGQFTHPKEFVTDKYGHYLVEASFKDENGGTISGRTESLINPYQYLPGIRLDKWLYQVDEKIRPEVAVVDAKGKRVKNIPLKLTVNLVNWIYERRLGSGNYFYYDSRKEVKEVKTCEFVSSEEFKSCPVSLEEAGYYEFEVTVRDKKIKSEPTVTSTYVWEKGSYMGFEAANHDRINLNVEKNDLKIGDTLKVMAISPMQDAEALITFERDGIIYSEQVKFKGNVLFYEKKIADEKLVPGFYVSVVIIKGRVSDKIEGQLDLGKPSFKIGYRRVEVNNDVKRLKTLVTSLKKQAEPGQEVEATVELKDYQGQGVQGELAIAVVDEALLSLAGPYKKNYDVLDTFYSLGALGVENFQTLTQLIGRRTFGKKGANPGGGGGMEVRSDFKNTAFWESQVETDTRGKHRFKFKVPDNLTTWKILAVAVDGKHRFGYGEDEILVSKPLMVEPAFPNFLVEGDKFNAKATVMNRSGSKQDIIVKAESKVFEIKENTKKLTLAHDDKGSVLFPIEVTRPVDADIFVSAKGGSAQDAFKLTLPVLKSSIVHAFSTHGTLKTEKVTVPLSLNPKMYPDTLALTLNYSNTAIDGLDEVFRYVLGYPYGCWEQRLSKAYFLVQYEEFKDLLTYRFPEKEGTIKKAVLDLLNLAAEYQTENGGMRYYPGGHDSPDAYLSIFTGKAFALMKSVGYKIESTVEKKLITYLKSLLISDSNWDSYYGGGSRGSNKALLLSVLFDLGEKDLTSHISKIFAERKGMDLFGLSFLAGYLATQKGYEKEAKTVFDYIDSLKVVTSNRTHYKEKANEEYKYWSYTETRAQCAVLQNLAGYSSDKAEVSSLVRGILQKLVNGHWYNTQENVYCFEGLRRFVNKFEKKAQAPRMEFDIDGKQVKVEHVVKGKNRSIVMTSKQLDTSAKNLTLENKSQDELYYSTVLRYETPLIERGKTKEGFELTKSIFRLLKGKENAQWQKMEGKTLKLKRGDTVRILIEVNAPAPRYQVMLNDRLAACFEPINLKLATTSVASGSLLTEKKYEWESPYYRGDGFEYMDLRLDAAQFYSRKLETGRYEVEYLLQVIATGEFNLPESSIEEMYYPDVRGTEIARKIIVEE